MVQPSLAIVLRNQKYGDSSNIVTMLTRKYGLQTYMVQGIRKATKTTAGKGMYMQPGNILSIECYHNEQRNLQRLKSFHFHIIYKDVLLNPIKNMIALFIMEVLYASIKQPEENEALFDFCEDVLIFLDTCENQTQIANLPLFFLIQLSNVLGFIIHNNFNKVNVYLDLQEGNFCSTIQNKTHYIEAYEYCFTISQLLKVQHPNELTVLALNQDTRKTLLQWLLLYFKLHINNFPNLKSIKVLNAVFS
jgi:DNA repair protein RecO (recombination protein O)